MSSEPETEDEYDFTYPLTDDQLQQLQSKLNSIAVKYARCEADRFDLVQQANLALIDGRRRWRRWSVCAVSAMLDYLKHRQATEPADYYAFGTEEGELNPADRSAEVPTKVGDAEWNKFEWVELTELQRQAAILYYVEGRSQPEIESLIGVSQPEVSRMLRRVREAVREQLAENGSETECEGSEGKL